MSKDIILKAENISKQYRLGLVGTGTVQHDLNRWWHKVRGKEDPYLKIGDVNDRSTKATSDYVWALEDINFEVERGEVLGIIGKNGAGKSTLLKILSRVTAPTTGSIKTKGRIASLLEVGTGFHGEMTGRENIFLNGSILGMTKKEISGKIDEIIEFSGCERYIDTPVKRYSSGMTVRLAFAVAAFLEPEILVVDEVLAVGDAEFQKKAIGKMQDMSRGGGRTVLFVSHNLAAVKSLCTRGILMENGRVKFEGGIEDVVANYMKYKFYLSERSWSNNGVAPACKYLSLIGAKVTDCEGIVSGVFYTQDDIHLNFSYRLFDNDILFTHGLNLWNEDNVHILSSHDIEKVSRVAIEVSGQYQTQVVIPKYFLAPGNYHCSFAVMRYNPFIVDLHELDILSFTVSDYFGVNSGRGSYLGPIPGVVRPKLIWN